MKYIITAFLAIVLLDTALSKDSCNNNVGEWLACNNPIVISFLASLEDSDKGKVLTGVNLTDGRQALYNYRFIKKHNATQIGVNIYTFEFEDNYKSYLYLDSNVQTFRLPDCETRNLTGFDYLDALPKTLSGDVYTWKDLKNPNEVVIVSCPLSEWYAQT